MITNNLPKKTHDQSTTASDGHGRWNSLEAFSEDGDCLGWIPAHDGDFFPEGIEPYITFLKRMIKEPESHPFPVRVDIDLTQQCNCDCTFCFSRKYNVGEYRNQKIPYEYFQNLIGELAKGGTKSVRFCGGGEPLMHPDIRTLIKLPKKYGLKLSLLTNGDFLDSDLGELIVNNVNNLHWSINAATDGLRTKIHRSSTRVNRLSDSLYWIEKIASARMNKNKTVSPIIWGTYLLLPENIHEAIPMLNKVRSIGIDSISFRPVYHGLHSKWSTEDRSRLREVLIEIEKVKSSVDFKIFTPKRQLGKENNNPNDFFNTCLSRNVRTVLESTSKGSYLQNCGIYRGTGSKCGVVVNRNVGFDDNWSQFTSSSNPVNAPKDCSYCIDLSMNNTLNFIQDILKKDVNATFSCIYKQEL